MIPAVHLTPKRLITREQTETRAFPLSEANMPQGNGTVEGIRKIIDFLDVEKSKRYIRTALSTYCNIYAYDYCCRMGAYLPRVWWTKDALQNLKFDRPTYGQNLIEMNANALYEWFPAYGAGFGWKEAKSMAEAQIAANQGKCVIMVAANKVKSKSGHIVAIVPQTEKVTPVGANGIVIYPVMSQAGASNKKYFASKWWDGHDKPRVYIMDK